MISEYQKLKIGNFLAEASALIMLPLMLLNTFGGIIAGIWLAIFGEWEIIGKGLLLAIGGPFFLSIPLGLSMLILVPMVMFLEKIKNPILQAPFAAIGVSLTIAVMIAWCYLCMFLLLNGTASNLIFPLLLWTYGAVTAPFIFLAQKDQQAGGGNEYSLLSLFFYQIGFLINMVIIGFFGFEIKDTLPVFVGVMTIAMLVQVAVMIAQTKN
jgi:MFS family permease